MTSKSKISERLIKWVVEADYDDLSDTQTSHLKRAFIDAIACGVGGSTTEIGVSLYKYLNGNSYSLERTMILGNGMKVSPRDAAFVNAILINALDYDDTYEDKGKALCHPGSTLFSVAMSCCSMKKVTGKEFIIALALGYEISGRIGESVQPTAATYENVWGLNHFMVFGAVIVACRLLGLDYISAVNAFGIAGVAANVPSAWKWNWDDRDLPLSWMKDMVSWPAESGLRSALLAKAGFKGCIDIFEGKQGFWRMCASDNFESGKITDNIGNFCHLEKLAFKPYPCCRWIHSSLDAFEKLLNNHDIYFDDIESIKIECTTELYNHFNVSKPSFMIDAEFSVPYAISMVAQKIPVGPKWYEECIINSPVTQHISSLVTLISSKELDREYFQNNRIAARVTIRSKTGETWQEECQQAHGGFDSPMSSEEHNEKISALIIPVYSTNTLDQLHGLIDNLENCMDVYSQIEHVFSM